MMCLRGNNISNNSMTDGPSFMDACVEDKNKP